MPQLKKIRSFYSIEPLNIDIVYLYEDKQYEVKLYDLKEEKYFNAIILKIATKKELLNIFTNYLGYEIKLEHRWTLYQYKDFQIFKTKYWCIHTGKAPKNKEFKTFKELALFVKKY